MFLVLFGDKVDYLPTKEAADDKMLKCVLKHFKQKLIEANGKKNYIAENSS